MGVRRKKYARIPPANNGRLEPYFVCEIKRVLGKFCSIWLFQVVEVTFFVLNIAVY